MKTGKFIAGFSKLSKDEKINWLNSLSDEGSSIKTTLDKYQIQDKTVQCIFDGFTENTVSNFILPLSVAPNFNINGTIYTVPMAIEESSVVAAAAAAAKFWSTRGGFKAEVIDIKKIGQVHFYCKGNNDVLILEFDGIKKILIEEASHITSNMEKRGGGVLDILLKDFTAQEPNYFQLFVTFDTCDSMGANFINSVLESFGQSLKKYFDSYTETQIDVLMSILSNYTPECLVKAEVSCKIEELGLVNGVKSETFADRFSKAIKVAHLDTFRATTHNKGIFNGIDAVVIATGNDFRSVESCGHTYACKDGQYKSLTHCSLDQGVFKFWIEIPFAIGTVGGLTKLHPLAKVSLEILGNPSAEELMKIIAATGLAQNFSAIRSLVTNGIQEGHMKMHLTNILNHMNATSDEILTACDYFKDKTISYTGVRNFIETKRKP
jgi:hydroxymethylglutaryl-CoA reductase